MFPLLALLSAAAFAQSDSRGAAIFAGQCAICHGQQGEGGRGPALAKPKLRNASDDGALRRIIRRGIPGGGMPGTWLNESEVQDVAAHVRSLGRTARTAPPPGDPSRGARTYQANGCPACHTLNGLGGSFGPDLTGIGARRSPAHLRTSVTDPAADIPTGFLLVRAATKAGRRLTGARVNEDTFSIQLRDSSGALHSLWKSDLTELHKDHGKSAMPAASLPPAQLDDLVAFLAGQEDTP